MDFVVKAFTFTIVYVNPDITEKQVGENNTQLLEWHWPGDDESILQIATSLINLSSLPIVNSLKAGLPDPSWII